jgi:hypothetical protein
MKSFRLAATVTGAAALVLLLLTNPKMPDYEQYVHQEILKKNENADSLSKTAGILFGGLASQMAANATIRSDYLIFSTYDTNLGDRRYVAVGLLNHFFLVKKPEQDKVQGG